MASPSVHNLLSNWLPPTERAKMGSYAYAGYPFGALVTFSGSGLLCKYGFADGWQSIFYIYGGASLLFAISWCLLVSETPGRQRFISKAEREFIESHVPLIKTQSKKETLYTPWKAIFTSMPVYAIVMSGIANDFYGIIMWFFLPMYLWEVMNFDISANGLLSSIPYIVQFLVSIVCGWISDAILKKNLLSIGALRKIFCSAGKLICIISLVAMGFIDCNQAPLAVVFTTLSLGAYGFMTIGYYVNPMDIAPAYSGLIVALVNTAGTFTGVVSPYIVSAITKDNPSRESWQVIFFISAAIMGAALIFFAIFAKGNVQPWAVRNSPDKPHLHVELDNEANMKEGVEMSQFKREPANRKNDGGLSYCSPEIGL